MEPLTISRRDFPVSKVEQRIHKMERFIPYFMLRRSNADGIMYILDSDKNAMLTLNKDYEILDTQLFDAFLNCGVLIENET